MAARQGSIGRQSNRRQTGCARMQEGMSDARAAPAAAPLVGGTHQKRPGMCSELTL